MGIHWQSAFIEKLIVRKSLESLCLCVSVYFFSGCWALWPVARGLLTLCILRLARCWTPQATRTSAATEPSTPTSRVVHFVPCNVTLEVYQ